MSVEEWTDERFSLLMEESRQKRKAAREKNAAGKEAKRLKREEERKYWAEWRAKAHAIVDRDLILFQSFHQIASSYFSGEIEGKVFEHKPHISMTFVALGEPRAKIAIRPYWIAHRKEFRPEVVELELLVERLKWTTREGDKTEQVIGTHQDLELLLESTKVGIGKYYPAHVEESVRRVVETLTAFMADPEYVLARSTENCCICGHGLTDEMSISRGIGPECLKKWNSLRSHLDRFARPR